MPFDDDDAPSTGGGDDLRSALAAAMTGEGTSAAPEVHEPEHHETPTDDDGAGAPAKTAAERARHPDGKFAPKPADQAAEGTEDKPQAATAAPTEAAPAAAPRPAPNSWKAEAKGVWASLPPAAQDEVLRREREADGERQQHAAARRTSQEFEQVIAPHADMIRRGGGSPAQAFAVLLNAQATLERDPAGALQEIARSYGIQITGLNRAPQGAPPQQPPAAPPRQAPQVDIGRIVDEKFTAWQQQQSLASEVQAFAARNPDYETLKPTMASLIQTGQATDLQDAYDKASWLEPTIRAKRIAEQTAPVVAQAQGAAAEAAAQAARAADQARVTRARNAAGSVRGAPGGATAQPTERSLREELEARILGR